MGFDAMETGIGSLPCEACERSAGTIPVCTGSDYLLGNLEGSFRAVRCAQCGFAFLESPPADLGAYYPARYFAPTVPPGLGWLPRALAGWEARWLGRQAPSVRSALEIGPGRGDFLLALRGACPTSQVHGFDITTGAGLRSIAPDVAVSYATSLEAAGFQEGRFDLVVMRHVLEHVRPLASFLQEVRRLVPAGGTLYVKVPNRSSWASRLFGCYWNGLDFPRHLSYFRTSDLVTVLQGAGFRVVATGHESDAVDWVGSTWNLLVGRLGLPARGGLVSALIRLALRVFFLPVSLLARLARRSSRVWVLARREDA